MHAPLTRLTGLIVVLSAVAMLTDFYLVVRGAQNSGAAGLERMLFEVPNALAAAEGPLIYLSLAAAVLMIAGIRIGAILYLVGQLLGSVLWFAVSEKFDQAIHLGAFSMAFGTLALFVVAKEWRVLEWVRPSMPISRIEGLKNAHG